MARQITATQPFQEKLANLIPAEIVGAYMVLAGILGFDPTSTEAAKIVKALGPTARMAEVVARIPDTELKPILMQIVFFALLALTPLYLWKVSKVSSAAQIAVTTVSYIVWVYTLGGPFVIWDVYYPLIAAVILVLWSVTMPLFVPAHGS